MINSLSIYKMGETRQIAVLWFAYGECVQTKFKRGFLIDANVFLCLYD